LLVVLFSSSISYKPSSGSAIQSPITNHRCSLPSVSTSIHQYLQARYLSIPPPPYHHTKPEGRILKLKAPETGAGSLVQTRSQPAPPHQECAHHSYHSFHPSSLSSSLIPFSTPHHHSLHSSPSSPLSPSCAARFTIRCACDAPTSEQTPPQPRGGSTAPWGCGRTGRAGPHAEVRRRPPGRWLCGSPRARRGSCSP